MIVLKNNASGTISTSISAADTGIALTTGDGAEFPTLGVGEYFYATLVATDDTFEIVKVTARSSDSITVVRAQEGTSALAFGAGSRIELRVTAQGIADAVTAGMADFLDTTHTWTQDQTVDAVFNVYGGNRIRLYNSADANPHGIRNNSNVLTFDYNTTTYLTANASGVVAFVNAPLVGASAIYYATGTDVAVTDGGTGASTASGARTNLGLVIGTDVQAYNAALASIAGLSTAAGKMIYATASNVYATTDLSSFARTLLDDTTAAAARATLALGTMSTQAASAVAITGGTVEGITSGQMRTKRSVETSGTLTSLSANTVVVMTGDVQLDASVFTADDIIMFVAGASARAITQGTGMTLRLAGTTTTGTRALAARGIAFGYVNTASEITIAGNGVS